MATLPCHLACELKGHQGAVRAVRFTVSGEYCISSGADKTVRLWNPHTGLPIKTYMGHGFEVLDAVASHDNSRLASCGSDKQVVLWDVSTGEMVRKFRGHIGRVNAVRFNAESTMLVSGSYDSSVRFWDCKSRRYDPVQILDEAKDSVSSVEVSAYQVLTGSIDGGVRQYDIRMGRLVTDTLSEPVTCVTFTKDGQCILVASLDNTLRLLDKDTGSVLGSYTGHVNKSYRIECCLSSTDQHVVSGSEDGRICFWDLVEGKLVHTLESGGRLKLPVHALAYHPKHSCLLSATSDSGSSCVQVWKGEDWKQAQESGHIPGQEEEVDIPVLAGYAPSCPREMLLHKQWRKI